MAVVQASGRKTLERLGSNMTPDGQDILQTAEATDCIKTMSSRLSIVFLGSRCLDCRAKPHKASSAARSHP